MEALSSILEWAWARHHNEWSWYVRPLFLLPYCYFAWRRSWTGLLVTLALFPTSLFWFPAPERPAPHVLAYLAWECAFFLEGDPWALVALAGAVAVYLWALAAAFWYRSILLGLLVINVGMGLKIAVSLGFGGEAGQGSVVPSLFTAAIVNVGVLFWRWQRSASYGGRSSEPQHDALPQRGGNE
ncbi:MAG: hypothetical protein AB7S70_05135 [Hyphomicrobium sp.]|uniref:hypothetical protein n=1 Tax=Hyphomicrobium sp. TaxID=82 RepID=UPI003D11F056